MHALITAPAIDTDLLWGLSGFFVGLALLYFVSVFLFRNKISSKSSRTRKLKTELSPMVSEFLFYESNADKEEKSNYIRLKIEIRNLLKDNFKRKILAEILLDLRKDVSGETQTRLFQLYQDLGLDKDAFQKLNSWRWEVVSKGILELTLMQVEDAYGFIVKFINNRRATIRKQAEIATVTLKPGGIDYFLDTTKYRISEWQQLKLLDVLRNKENFEPPRFKSWLTSTNKHVVLFSLRLIKFYRQNDANASLIELLKHKNSEVRQQAIGCIEEFNITDALPILKGVFWRCTVDIKIAILGAIAELGTARDIEFLESVSQKEGNFSVKSKAVGAINTISPESVMPTEGIEYVKAYDTPELESDGDTPTLERDSDQAREGPEEVVKEELSTKWAEPEPTKAELIEAGLAEPERAEPETTETEPIEINSAETEQTETEQTEPEQNVNLVLNQNPPENRIPMAHSEHPHQVLKNIEVIFEEIKPVSSVKKQNEDQAFRNIEVIFEEIQPIPSDEEPHIADPDLDHPEIDFLPIVVADETVGIPEQNQVSGDIEIPDEVLSDIEVHFIEISQESLDEELEALVAEIKEISFLPFVTDEKTEESQITHGENEAQVSKSPKARSGPLVDKKEVNEPESPDTEETKTGPQIIHDYNVEKVVGEADSEDLGAAEKSEESLVPEKADQTDDKTEAKPELENIEGYSLSDFEVSFAEKDSDIDSVKENHLDFHLQEKPIIDYENPQVDDVMSWLLADNELREIECHYQTVPYPDGAELAESLIPEPVYYDEHEAYMMGLLDELEELGDHREIPLLQELGAEESKNFIKDRIEGIIYKFNWKMNSKKNMMSTIKNRPTEIPVFSVFADLFKNIDTESKLILLDEVVAVGDEKEIEFLDRLLEDPDHKIRDKAQAVLRLLIAKLSHENPSATYSKGVSDIVAEQIKSDEKLGQQLYEGLLHEMNLSPATETGQETASETEIAPVKNSDGTSLKNPEIFDIDFELGITLNDHLDQKIRDLPVVATEVSPRESGGSLFSQLRNFTKLF